MDRGNFRRGACWGVLLLAAGLGSGALAQEIATDAAALNARAAALDPEDYKFVQPVCTRCHAATNFFHYRSWPQWQSVFSQMHANGAETTDDGWGHIYRYFRRNMTLINVNHADEDELSDVLEIDEKTAIFLVQRRSDRKFDSAEELEQVPGVNKALIEAMRPRLVFDLPALAP